MYASGASRVENYYHYRYFDGQGYPWGLQATGNATVMFGINYGNMYYASVDEENCDGGPMNEYFVGPYSYMC
ncbi:MAG: hypothetical protein LAP40_27780 [Acidobacteriia bacterium]|nr:hypothetical protein [Terriglobia bacterium]